MPTGKRPNADEIMDLARAMCAASGPAYVQAHRKLEQAVYCALHAPELDTTIALVRRASNRMRHMHRQMDEATKLLAIATRIMNEQREEIAQLQAHLAMIEDPAPLAAIHGEAANQGQAKVAA